MTEVPAEPVTTSVIPTPTWKSFSDFTSASLVTLCFGSSITTSPIISEDAKDVDSFGSDIGLSLST